VSRTPTFRVARIRWLALPPRGARAALLRPTCLTPGVCCVSGSASLCRPPKRPVGAVHSDALGRRPLPVVDSGSSRAVRSAPCALPKGGVGCCRCPSAVPAPTLPRGAPSAVGTPRVVGPGCSPVTPSWEDACPCGPAPGACLASSPKWVAGGRPGRPRAALPRQSHHLWWVEVRFGSRSAGWFLRVSCPPSCPAGLGPSRGRAVQAAGGLAPGNHSNVKDHSRGVPSSVPPM
jgi:hypothetical protein